MNKKVSIYSTQTCQYCKMAKEFFAEKGVEYEEFDVTSDQEKQQEMITKSGQMGVPVIIVADVSAEEGGEPHEEVIVGFDKPRLMELLGLSE